MTELTIDKNVYLLGAGFSKEIGLPLQDEFLLVAQEVYFKNTQLYKNFERVFEYKDKLSRMKHYLSYPLLNLEQLFNLIEMDIFYSKNSKLQNIKNDFIKLICDVLIDKTPNPFINDSSGRLIKNDIYEHYLKFLRLFIKNVKPQFLLRDDTIISFNYDLVLEGAVCLYNWQLTDKTGILGRPHPNIIRLNTLFGKSNIINSHPSEYFTKNRPNSYFPPENWFSDDNNSLKLIKLHGSINWKRANNNKIFIVPPTWNKSDPQIRNLWDMAYKELMSAKRIIFIGYSFPETDIYVKSLLGLAVNQNNILQNIFFINPDKEIAKNLCLSILDNYFKKHCAYIEKNFSEFINDRDLISKELNR